MIDEFSYTLEDEKIVEYLRLSTEEKLNWLEEIAEFNHLVLDTGKEKAPPITESDRTRQNNLISRAASSA